jgi:integrase
MSDRARFGLGKQTEDTSLAQLFLDSDHACRFSLILWTVAAKITEGKIFRAVRKNDKVSGASLSTTAVWKIVLHYAHQVRIERLAPHDLRRTSAKLSRKSGGDLEQIQFLLGHSSIQATEKYLGGEQDIANAVNDRIFARVKRFQSNSE